MVDTLSRMRQLIGTSAQWAANNIVLGDGELGVEVVDTSTRRMKVGDGTRTWSALPYTSITQGALDGEAAARAADATLQTNINNEASARTTADANEVTARQAADTAETNARIAADNAEITARGNADTTLQTNITNETNARIAADTAEATTRGNADTAETNARTAADTTLQTNINNEASARTTADATEVTNRTNADNALGIRITALEGGTAGTAADIAALETGLAAEQAARAGGDDALDDRLGAIEDQHLDQRVAVLENQQASLPPPPWVKRATIGGVEKMARCHARFSSNEYWCDAVRSFEYLINYEAADTKMYCDDAGQFVYANPNVPIITSHGLMFWRAGTFLTKYNRDLRVQYRATMTGLSGGEFFTDGDAVTTSAGGAGKYIAGEANILLLTGWTGAAPANGHILTGPNAVVTVGTVTTLWVHSNVTVTRDQPGIDGAANAACRVTATAANATIYQSLTAISSTRRCVAFLRRSAGVGEIALGIDGAIWTPRAVTSSQWARFASDQQTLANPRPGLRLAVSGNSVVVDFMQAPDRGPTQEECYTPGQTGGLGTAELAPPTGNVQVNLGDPHCWLKRSFGSFMNDITRFTVLMRCTPLTSNPGGTFLQVDTDGTDMNVAVNNCSTIGTGSNNNFGVTYRASANPPGFGNDPDGPKATGNLPHVVAWTMNANDTGGGMAMSMIVADGSGARVNVAHPPDHYPRGLQYVRIGHQWAYNLYPTSPGYNHTVGFVTEFAIFDGVPTASELEAMAPASQLGTVAPTGEERSGEELLPDDGTSSPIDGAPSVTFVCPRSTPGRARLCTHPPDAPIACPGCGWAGAIVNGVAVEDPTS